MFRGFNLNLDFKDQSYYDSGLKFLERNNSRVRQKIRSFLNPDGSLDGTKMQEDWFPLIEADIFVSHSHKDEARAITLAGWLWDTFEMKTFIDSCIWENFTVVLKEYDDAHCSDDGGITYSYKSRNFSTSHFHMMLSTALNMMIDNTECLFFLYTPNSVQRKEKLDKTDSPWIFSEIETTKLIRKKPPERYSYNRTFSKADGALILEGKELPKIEYVLKMKHLTKINSDDLVNWEKKFNEFPQDKHALDILYDLKPPYKPFVFTK